MRRLLASAGLLSLCAAGVHAIDRVEQAIATEALQQAVPSVKLYHTGGKLSRAYGAPLAFGASSVQSADGFVQQHASAFGAAAADLERVPQTQPVRYDAATGEYRFTLTTYEQQRGGVPVFRSGLKVLTLNTADNAVVWAGSNVRTLGDFEVPEAAAAGGVQPADVQPGFDTYSDVETVIYVPLDAEGVEQAPVLATSFIAERGTVADPATYAKLLYVVDAATGEVLLEEDQVLHVDVAGNVSHDVTADARASACTGTVTVGMPYARVSIGGTIAYADVNGDFVIPNGGSGNVTVNSEMRGRWFNVNNQAGSDASQSQSVTPPGPANFLYSFGAELNQAQVDAYYQANVVRDFTLEANPSYPTIGTQTDWPVNVNINDSCNAFYNGGSINFYTSGGGCNNTAFGDVVHHEYGHHLVNRAGSGQGAYGEGMGDVMGVLITGRAQLGVGFNSCANGIRNANNSMQYPCSGAIHTCGQLISGCVWDTWQELQARNDAATALEIMRDLAVNAMLLRSGGDSSIAPDIFVDYLTIDDNDGDLGNGTPNAAAILAGFDQHNMVPNPSPVLPAFIDFPNGVPFAISPGGAVLTAQVSDGFESVDPSTVELRIRPLGGTFQSVAMTGIGGDLYQAALPGGACGDSFEFFVRADTVEGTMVRNPDTGSLLTATVGSEAMAFEDNFESNLGWTTEVAGASSGDWQRGIPVNDPGWDYDPVSDADGSGRCYLTQNQNGNTDVDNGAVRLLSPVLDLSGALDVVIRYDYYLYLTNSDGSDALRLGVSNSGPGGPWSNLVAHDTDGGLDWRSHVLRKSDLDAVGVTLTDNMVFRFIANDADPQSIVEAGVDAFAVVAIDCNVVDCPADLDGSGEVELNDLLLLLGGFHAGDAGDIDGDGDTDLDDLLLLLAAFGTPCA